jgi:hypothetical protein
MKKIVLDPFIYRQFKSDYSGTKLNIDINTPIYLNALTYFESVLNDYYSVLTQEYALENMVDDLFCLESGPQNMPFCKYMNIKNRWDILPGTIQLTPEIERYVKTGYNARSENELPILSRWVELPHTFEIPTANRLIFVLYSKEQLRLEAEKTCKDLKEFDQLYTDTVEYGAIAAFAVSGNSIDPMVPITMMRNALGCEEGGNGVPLNRDLYMQSVEFWNKNILIK